MYLKFYYVEILNCCCGNYLKTVNLIYAFNELIIYPTHLTFVYTGSVSCSKPLRASKVCSFIQKKRLQKNESMLDSSVPLLGFALQLLLGCSYWASRFYSLCFEISSMFSILFRDFLLEYSAMIFRYEISLLERLHNNHQVRLYLQKIRNNIIILLQSYT
ncbi:Hypothetical_protein [Hexamita inflata]|uniref:Hypothetical_protein n=1 Tax=Hexamita inflata TaxID=28002 RepID=A0AA86UCD5_9EUKA|nr:Hypothetical protein HINF_LOCUS40080 [Hexamita inflata]